MVLMMLGAFGKSAQKLDPASSKHAALMLTRRRIPFFKWVHIING